MEKVAYFLLLSMFGASLKCDKISKFHFQRISTKDGYILKTVGPSLKTTTPTQCARMCSLTSPCTRFVWDEDLHNCSIGSETVPNPNGVLSIDGKQRAYDLLERCPTRLGFENVHFGNTDMCIRYIARHRNMAHAREQCGFLKASLVKTNTREKIDLVLNFLAKSVSVTYYYFGIGLTDEESEETFVWSDGQVMTAEEMILFDSGEPKNDHNPYWLVIDGLSRKLVGRGTRERLSYVCEVRNKN